MTNLAPRCRRRRRSTTAAVPALNLAAGDVHDEPPAGCLAGSATGGGESGAEAAWHVGPFTSGGWMMTVRCGDERRWDGDGGV